MRTIIVLLLTFITLSMIVLPQKESSDFKGSVKVDAKLLAYDFSEAQSNVSSAPSQYTFVFEVLGPLKMRGKLKYIKVIYRSFGTKDVDDLFFSNSEKLFRLKLLRQNECDGTLMEMESKGASLIDPKATDKAVVSKLTVVGITYFRAVMDSDKEAKLPCYELKKIL